MAWLMAGACVAGAAVSLLLTPLSMVIANRLRLLDTPDPRKIHNTPTPRLGGIGIVGGTLAAAIPPFIYVYGADPGEIPNLGRQYLAILLGSLCVFTVGLIDDLSPVSSRFKLMALLVASCVVCGAGGALSGFRSIDVSIVEFPWISWVVTALWITGVAVAFNFIDGLDGLSGGLGLIASLVLASLLLMAGQYAAAVAPLALAGGILGFLYFNWHPARTFMGDGGSMTIGFLLGSLTIVSNQSLGTVRSLVLPGLALSVALVDGALTLFRRRYQQRRSMFSAERGHIHHRLLDLGLSHQQAVVAIHAVSLACVGVGFISLTFDGWSTLGGLVLVIPLLWGLFHTAGSVRAGEMIAAIRRKRDFDRSSRRAKHSFEALQLEFDSAGNFSEWWTVVCRAAERFGFASIELPLTPTPDNKPRVMRWEHLDQAVNRAPEIMEAKIPVKLDASRPRPTSVATVRVPSADGLEHAGERLALFSRLMDESGDKTLRRIQIEQRQSKAKPHADFDGEFGHLRVALVHDFFYTYCGAERVVEQIINVFPHCDVFGLFDFLPESERGFLRDKRVNTTFIHNLPFAKSKHRSYLPLMPLAIEQLDVSDYDLVISSSYLVAKGVITGPDQLHICYCHSPVRYGWDLQHQYLKDAGLGFGPRGILARWILHYLRNWDARSSLGVDHFVANSKFVARRIEKVYRRQAGVLPPPVDTLAFTPPEGGDEAREDYYVVASRLVPYKRIDLIVEAITASPDRKLIVIGDGPERERLESLAGANVRFLGHVDQATIVHHMQRAKAFVFAAEEDFGIVPVEAMACGTPVIAYGKGGVAESVIPNKTGIFFKEQTAASLNDALDRFEMNASSEAWPRSTMRQRAEQYSAPQFVESLTDYVRKQSQSKWPTKSAICTASPQIHSSDSSSETEPTDAKAEVSRA